MLLPAWMTFKKKKDKSLFFLRTNRIFCENLVLMFLEHFDEKWFSDPIHIIIQMNNVADKAGTLHVVDWFGIVSIRIIMPDVLFRRP